MLLSGVCLVCALYDLGFRFDTASVEIQKRCRDIASDIDPAICHYHSNDVTKLGKAIRSTKFDVLLNSSSCQPISGCNPRSTGWGDGRIDAFEGACFGRKAWDLTNPNLQSIDETVVPGRHLDTEAIIAKYDEKWGDPHFTVNATHLGALDSRPRIWATSYVKVRDIPHSTSPEINYMLDDGWRSVPTHAPCVVASEITHNPPLATNAAGIQRQFTAHESLRVMGYPDTVLGGRAMQTLTAAEI